MYAIVFLEYLLLSSCNLFVCFYSSVNCKWANNFLLYYYSISANRFSISSVMSGSLVQHTCLLIFTVHLKGINSLCVMNLNNRSSYIEKLY